MGLNHNPMNLEAGIGYLAKTIVRRLHEAGYIALFAGGSVRDHLLGVSPKDFDIATTALPDQVEQLFEKTIPVGKQFGVIIVVLEGMEFEVATFRSEGPYLDGRRPENVEFTDPKEDAMRRDFTINGLFYDPLKNEVLDYVEGLSDLESRVVRCIGDPIKRFQEDKLRLMRAIRFSALLDYPMHIDTWNAVKKGASNITVVSKERIRDELDKILVSSGAARGLSLLWESGLCEYVFPQIWSSLNSTGQAAFFEKAVKRLGKSESAFRPLKWACVFSGLSDVGILKRELSELKCSKKFLREVVSIIEAQVIVPQLQSMSQGKVMVFLGRSDIKAVLSLYEVSMHVDQKDATGYYFLKEKMELYKGKNLHPIPLVDGSDLKSAGVRPGPEMKELLERIYELQLEERFMDKKDVLKWLEKEL